MVIDLNRTPGYDHVDSEPDRVSVDDIISMKNKIEYSGNESGEDIRGRALDIDIGAEIEKRLEVGTVVDSLDQVYVLYCEYARCKGFSVRKGTQRYFEKSSEISMKVFYCSCEGQPDNKRSMGRIPAYKKQVTRSNCKARIRVLREVEGPWKISIFHKAHNHELVNPDQSYLLRSARNLSHAKQSILESLIAAGIPISRACKFMEKESGGRENVGFTRKDAYAHTERMRAETKVENGDANAILQFFTEMSKKDPLFYWKIELDDEGRLMHFFFRDSRCAMDYEYFGDVVSFDTTYKTNKYNMVCAPIIGINHHFQNVMFGLGFLSDEKSESFEWLFSAFLDSMYGKEPGVIFSDQCQALMHGLDNTFESAKHRLCQWHINRNASGHFGSLNGNIQFMQQWQHLMNMCETEDEFEALWEDFSATYNLGSHRWLRSMYSLRRRWSSVFTNLVFTAGLHATSRSEVTNRILKKVGKRSNSLFEFVMQFNEIQAEWRTQENAEDAECRGMPGIIVDGNMLLTHIARVFTRNIFKMFEYEATQSMNVEIVQHPLDYFAIELEFQLSSSANSVRRVVYNKYTGNTSCTCRFWESNGIFCCHIFKVYYLMNVHEVPEQYILRRWRRDCKERWRHEGAIRHLSNLPNNFNGMLFVNLITRTSYDMAYEAMNNPTNMVQLLEDIFKIRDKRMGKSKSPSKRKSLPEVNDDDPNSLRIRNPQMAKTRGVRIQKNGGRRKGFGKGKARKNKRQNAPTLVEPEIVDDILKPVQGGALSYN